ncbi:hypothetical protein L207DRAFT_576029 [Hyaloscypha variabilis F]|uniref:Uncharacterized protein n=1 Tax=Hyaloscypha variabilis (strain UAMH 11265 / GT02V1 / F) TaxID=1149755 RepID=A0A2J6S903_HYAVF|nr:hypothetical protein L207DRAFT_576029 [Hyaloscypha variabilis F]
MDLGQIGFEKAQAMMPYLRAMLRNAEREIVSSRESSSTLIMNEGSRDPISSDEEAPSTDWKEDEMIAKSEKANDSRSFRKIANSDISSNWTADSEIEGSVTTSEDTVYTSMSEMSTITVESLTQPIYSWKDLRDILLAIAKRTTFDRWVQIFADCEYFPPQVTVNDLYTICLRYCEVSGKIHNFHELRRCIRCDVQLCRECERCLLKRCELGTDDPPFEPREELRKETVAAKRIWSACRKSQHHRRLIVELDQDCNCTEFLMSPFHDCKEEKHHMCNDCYENALVLLRQPNSRIVATGGDSQVQSQVEYSCSCGASGNVEQPAVCKICLRYCHFHCLDEADRKACAEGEKEWNQGSCPWVLSSVETSLTAWRVVKTYRCYLEDSDTDVTDGEGSAEYTGNQTA